MRILISNDDGIFAPGLAALVDVFSGAGHEVVVCAPDSQRSAASHSMTLVKPLTVREMNLRGAAKAYAISGTPVDCVKLGLRVLYPEAEFVISGINHGYNAGTDILYSGTVGAAMEGALLLRPAMAVSLAACREDTYDLAAQMALKVFDMAKERPMPRRSLLNLNYPACDRAKGLKVAPMRSVIYEEEYRLSESKDGERTYCLSGSISDVQEDTDGDYALLCQGYATLTVLHYDLTHDEQTDAWRALLEV